MILEPLKAKSSIQNVSEAGSNLALDSFTIGRETGRAAGTALSETTTIGGVEFQGVYDVKKYINYIDYTSSNTERYTPLSEGFYLAVDIPSALDYTIIDLSFWYYYIVNDTPRYEYIEMQFCNVSDFPNALHDELNRVGIEELICPSRDDIELFSRIDGHDNGQLVFQIVKCQDQDYCEDIFEIDRLMKLYTRLEFIYIDQEFNYHDLDNPIHYRVNYNGFIELMPSVAFQKYYYLSQNRVIVNDTTEKFYNLQFQFSITNSNTSNEIGFIFIVPTTRYDVYIPYINYQPVVSSSLRNLDSK